MISQTVTILEDLKREQRAFNERTLREAFPMPPAIARLIERYGIDARVNPDELRREFERDNAERVCAGCGCTDSAACIDRETGAPCAWVEGYDGNICTHCAEIATLMAYVGETEEEFPAPGEEHFISPPGYDDGYACEECGAWLEFGRESEMHGFGCSLASADKTLHADGSVTQALVQLYSEREANRAITELRAGRGKGVVA